MKALMFACISLILLVSCSSAPGPLPSPAVGTATITGGAGIFGQVVLGPTCPVVRKDTPCADKPYQATLTVLTVSRQKVVQFTTDADGNFRIPLDPGEYILHPESPSGSVYPFGREQSFTVFAGQFSQLTISYDSGMR